MAPLSEDDLEGLRISDDELHRLWFLSPDDLASLRLSDDDLAGLWVLSDAAELAKRKA